MAGGYLISEAEHTEDSDSTTQPKELSVDSPCGAAALSTIPAPILTKEVL